MSSGLSSQPPVDPADAAIWWSTRHRLGLLTSRDRKAFEKWLAEPDNSAAWEAVEESMDAMDDFAALPEVRAMREAALVAQPNKVFFLRSGVKRAALAAGIAIGLFFGVTLLDEFPTNPVSEQTVATQRYVTHVGERKNIQLADGSQVTLDAASILETSYTSTRRELRLLSGQALFHVAKDASRPFVVSAGNGRVLATGTMFNVRLNDSGLITVLLVEGRVSVDPLKRGGLGKLIPAVSRQGMGPGESLSISATGEISIGIADVRRLMSWTEGQVVFRDEPLASAVNEMNRYSATQLVIRDPQVAQLKVSGVFKTDPINNFSSAITAFYPIEAVEQSPGVVALKWRGGGK